MVGSRCEAYPGDHAESSGDSRTFVEQTAPFIFMFYGRAETKGLNLTLSKQSSNETTYLLLD